MMKNGSNDVLIPGVQSSRLHYLDGLRGIAVLGVVLVHAGQVAQPLSPLLHNLTNYGSRGVELFFVVSAFTMMAVYGGRRDISWKQFYLRRFFRIAPMFYLALVVYAFLAALAGQPKATGDVLVTLLFVHGWSPTAYNNVVPGGWSIACEATFYLAFPLILRVARGLVTAIGIALGAFVIGLMVMIIGPGLIRPWAGANAEDFLYFSFLTHASSFLFGVAAYLVFAFVARSADVRRSAWAGLGAVLLVLVIFLCAISGVRALTNFLVAGALFGALMVLVALADPKWLGSGAIAWLGRVSFSVYLTHFLLWEPAELVLSHIGGPAPLRLLIAYSCMLGGALFLSWLTYRWIETPMIALGHRLTTRSVDAKGLAADKRRAGSSQGSLVAAISSAPISQIEPPPSV